MTNQPTSKELILRAALYLAEREGFSTFTRDSVAAKAGCAQGLVNHHYGTMQQLRRAVMGEAIRTRNLKVLAQGLALRDRRAMGAPDALKRAAIENLMGA